MTTNTRLPQAHTDMIIALNEKGSTAQAIADSINRQCDTQYTKNSIIGKLNRLENIRLDRKRA